MTIAIPLIALVVLLVVWAKCCPEITDERRYVFPFDPQHWEALLDAVGKLRDAFIAMVPAAQQAARHMEHLHFELTPREDP